MDNFIWWGLLFGLCLLLELSSPGYFFFLSFCCGAVAAGLLSSVYDSLPLEFALFLGITAVAFMLLRRYAVRLGHKKQVKTNVYALVGKKGIVHTEITPLVRGWITLDGEMWAAAPADSVTIEKGALVEVVNSAGSHVIVKKITNA